MNTHLFQKISSMFGNPTLDLFPFPISHQIDRYISWKPDPKAQATDAFSSKWNTEFYYIFPVFSLLGKVTAKIYRDKTKRHCSGLQMAYTTLVPSLLRKATRSMTITLSAKKLVQPQDVEKVHPRHQKLHLQVPLID